MQHGSMALQANSSLCRANHEQVEVLMNKYNKASFGGGECTNLPSAVVLLFLQHISSRRVLQWRMLRAA
jgi:hypothetical protein